MERVNSQTVRTFDVSWKKSLVRFMELHKTWLRSFRVAHASRVLVSASRRNNLLRKKFAIARRNRQHSRRARYPESFAVPFIPQTTRSASRPVVLVQAFCRRSRWPPALVAFA